MAFFLTGSTAMLLSFLIREKFQYRLRWLFGAGVFLFIMCIGIESTALCQDRSKFTFPDNYKTYRGVVTDSPQDKPRSTAYKVFLPEYEKQVVCYFQKDSLTDKQLHPGDEFLFYGKIQPFRNMGNPDDFDYVRYMYNQGFAGSAYVGARLWKATGKTSSNLKHKGLNCRRQIMDFYQSLGFNETEYGILSALTLGYQDALADDLKQSFRTTGTVHVLSVSGLHTMIIFMMISFLLNFIKRGTKYYWIKPLLIIILLWVYAFITGLPPSVVRASGMLTVFCTAEIFRKKNFSLHALFIAAFFMLLINPFSIFDIGFQLSFMSVLSILYLHPKASALWKVENKYLKKVWQMFTISIVAQLATFPICLYYFGTFPTYFFITNLFIVPMVSLITYAVGFVALAKILSIALPDFSSYFYYLPVKALQLLVHLMTSAIRFFEGLPYALIDNMKISASSLILVFLVIIGFILFWIYKKPKALITGLAAVFIMLLLNIYDNQKETPETFMVYNRHQSTEIRWNNNLIGKDSIIPDYKFVETGKYKTLIISSNIQKGKVSNTKYEVDNLILTTDENHSLYSLTEILSPKNVILDGSLSAIARRRLSKECQKLNIPYHDVVENGAFSLIF